MEKTVFYAKIIFWLSFTVLIFNSEPSAGWEIFIIIVCSIVIQWGSTPNPKIKKGRIYLLKLTIAHNHSQTHTVVLTYDENENVETFRCRYVLCSGTLKLGEKYTIEKMHGDLFFTPS